MQFLYSIPCLDSCYAFSMITFIYELHSLHDQINNYDGQALEAWILSKFFSLVFVDGNIANVHKDMMSKANIQTS